MEIAWMKEDYDSDSFAKLEILEECGGMNLKEMKILDRKQSLELFAKEKLVNYYEKPYPKYILTKDGIAEMIRLQAKYRRVGFPMRSESEPENIERQIELSEFSSVVIGTMIKEENTNIVNATFLGVDILRKWRKVLPRVVISTMNGKWILTNIGYETVVRINLEGSTFHISEQYDNRSAILV